MSELKPIEPECRAMCVNPDAMGETCTVLNILRAGDEVPGLRPGHVFIADRDCWLVVFDDGCIGFFRDQFLIRIDDDILDADKRRAVLSGVRRYIKRFAQR